jgi:ribosomal protein L21
MKKDNLGKTLMELTDELVKITKSRDEFEVKYELEKARMLMSAEIQAFSNQTIRDSQVIIKMEAKGLYRKMAELKSKARTSWYKWSAVKSLVDGKVGEE